MANHWLWIHIVLSQSFLSMAQMYDYIIVGAGTAGCLLAERLSEVKDWSILVIEAGGNETFLTNIPVAAPIYRKTPWSWGHVAEKNDSFGLGLKNKRLVWPSGKVLGGTSVINDMIYSKGNQGIFDETPDLGNGWWDTDKRWDNRTVTKHYSELTKESSCRMEWYAKYYDGINCRRGTLNVTYPTHQSQTTRAFIAANTELRNSLWLDYWRNSTSKFSLINKYDYIETTTVNGYRVSSNRAFLSPALRIRGNLHVITKRTVTKILIDNKKRAYGVEYKWLNLVKRQIHAKKGVILSAGTINSPQLLMLSGIGPEEHLMKLNIPVVQNLRVGDNLRDHVSLANLHFVYNSSVSIRKNKLNSIIGNMFRLTNQPQSVLTVPGGFQAWATFNAENENSLIGPEIELLFSEQLLSVYPFYLSPFNSFTEEFNEFYKSLANRIGFTIIPFFLTPYSAGRIRLRSSEPHSQPLIYPDYFSDPRDIQHLIKAIRTAINLMKTEAFQALGADLYREPIPTCKQLEFDSDEYWNCTIRHMTMGMLNAVGTCKMGLKSDPDAVVDRKLKVRGIENLRVVDASVLPSLPSGHIMASVYMLAANAADIIKEEERII